MNNFKDGKILEIDLSKRTHNVKILDGETYKKYPGGSALATYLIARHMDPSVDPLSADNLLVFAVSPFTGLPIAGLSRVVVSAKSPLTGTIGDSQAGGYFPIHMKANGWDAVVFYGRSDIPVYVYLNGHEVRFVDAKNIWGRTTKDSEDIIRKELNENDIEISQIGIAGEKLVKYACILNMCNRANGRNGMGAVMGSKNLKALVVKKGVSAIPYDKEGFKTLASSMKMRLKENNNIAGLGEHGTAGDLEPLSEEGFLPTRNWQSGYFPEGANNITGATMTETILKKRDTCYACPIRCKRVVEIPGKVDPVYGGPEYETAAAFGSYCGVKDLESVALANQLCNMYGLDTISCGAVIAFAMECYEKGVLKEEDLDGIGLSFADSQSMLEMIRKIAYREGIGNLLAEGTNEYAKHLGGAALELDMSVKGQELPAHMPQYKPGIGIVYAVNPFGADHQSSEHDTYLMMPDDSFERKRLARIGVSRGYDNPYEMDGEKIKFARITQQFYSVLDTLCMCQFVWGPTWQLFGPDDIITLYKVGIGVDVSIDEILKIGERRINMMRQFNAKIGFSKYDDKLPKRIFKRFDEGPSKGYKLNKEDFENAILQYYKDSGWDVMTGNPTIETLERLSLSWMF